VADKIDVLFDYALGRKVVRSALEPAAARAIVIIMYSMDQMLLLMRSESRLAMRSRRGADDGWVQQAEDDCGSSLSS
jgi:hypothetical protein